MCCRCGTLPAKYCLLLLLYVHFDFTNKLTIFGDPVLRQLELRSVHVMYTVLLVNVLTVRIFENIIVKPEYNMDCCLLLITRIEILPKIEYQYISYGISTSPS